MPFKKWLKEGDNEGKKLALRLKQNIRLFQNAVVKSWELQERARRLPAHEGEHLSEAIQASLLEAAEAWNAILAERRRLSEEIQRRLQALSELAAMDTAKANVSRRTEAMGRFTQKLLDQIDAEMS